MGTTVKTHYHYIDKLRGFLTSLVILHHSAISFGASGGWFYQSTHLWEPASRGAMGVVIGVNQAFFMALFFFISSWLMPGSLERKGTVAFVKDRLLRLGVPLLLFIFVLNPLLVGLIHWQVGGTTDWMQLYVHHLDPGPMWFVLTLLVFEFMYVGWRSLCKGQSASSCSETLPSFTSIIVFMEVMAVAAFTIRLFYPTGTDWFSLQFGFFPLYVGMFYCGILAYRNRWLQQLEVRKAIGWFVLSLAAIGVYVKLVYGPGFNVANLPGGWSKEALVYAVWEPLVCVGFSYFLLAAFKRWGNGENVLCKTMAADSYMTYILHPYPVVGGTFIAQYAGMSPWIGFVFVSIFSVICSFGVAHLIRKIRFVQRCGW